MPQATQRGPHLVRSEPAHSPESRSLPAVRFVEFDAIRATAIFLVVTLHAALAYTHIDIPRLLWGVREPTQNLGFDWFCWWAMGISVPLFFTISGFFAAMAVASKGAEAFWQGRVRRVVVPGFAVAPAVLPLCFFAWAVGWLLTDRCDFREIRRLRFADPAIETALYGPAHLWFVEYLIPILWAYSLASRQAPARPVRWLIRWWAPLALAVPSAGLMLLHRRWTGVDAGIDRHNSIFPEPLRLLHFGVFFIAGSALYRTPGWLDLLKRRGWWLLALSGPIFAFRGWMLPLDWASDAPWSFSILAAGAGALGSWFGVLGLIGVYRRVCTRVSPLARYLAASSFWVYIVHLPIVGLMQADLYGSKVAPVAKFAATLVVTLGLGLASFEVFVRTTALGRFLDGRWGLKPQPMSTSGTSRIGTGPVRHRVRPKLSGRRARRDRQRSRR